MIVERLKHVLNEEKVTCDPEALECLVQTSGGDMRRAITCAQSCARLKGKGGITKEDVLEVTGVRNL